MSKIKRFIPIFVAFVFFAISFGMYSVSSSSREESLNKQANEITELKNRLNIKEKAVLAEKERVLKNVTGLDRDRVEKDKKVIERFFKKTFSWSSYKDYEKMRFALMSEYKLTKDSDFMKVFAPEVINTKMDGKDYNRIDVNGYNMSFDSVTPYVTKIAEDKYSYFSIVRLSTKSKDGGEALSNVIARYTIDSTGNISDLHGDIISE